MYLIQAGVGPGLAGKSGQRLGLLAALVAASLTGPPVASARLNGILTSSCQACHGGGRAGPLSISIEPSLIELGSTATVTVRVPSNGPAGFYLYSFGKGQFKEIPGQGARLATPNDVIHASPKGSVGGAVTFQVSWTAPAAQGTVTFEALAVAANGDRTANGDSVTQGRLSVAVGCPGVERFADADRDGFGTTMLPKEQVCEGTPGFATRAGDCNDYLAYVYPGAAELCNALDDDCDGQIDEGLESAVVYRDADGDGFGARLGTDMRVGCTSGGYAPNRDDCDDGDKNVHPGSTEVCNNQDDDCNGRIDEEARATCGLGWCRRNAEACDARTCTTGPPRAEQCNLFDDDCDGAIDNGATCEDAGKVCFGGRCLVSDDAKASAEAMGATADGGAAKTGGSDGGNDGGSDGGLPVAGPLPTSAPAPNPAGEPPPPRPPDAAASDSTGSVSRPSSLWGCSYGPGASLDRMARVSPRWASLLLLSVLGLWWRLRLPRRWRLRRQPPI